MMNKVTNVESTSTSNPSTPNPKSIPFAIKESSPQKRKWECYHCKKMGHWIKDCPDRSNKKNIEIERIPTIKTFFCRALPSLPSNMPLVNDSEEFNTEPSKFRSSCPGSADDAKEDKLEDSIRMAFSQAALQVQSKLLCRLEFMDPREHATMEREANIAFSALNSLEVNYGPFAEHIREFICSAKSLAEIDASICREDASERLEHEKVCRDNLSHLHSEIINELRTSRKQVQSLCEEENKLKNKLLQIETQRAQYEDKAKNLEDRLVKISKETLESEYRLQAVTQEVDKAMKFKQLREKEQDAMKKAMKNARACLTKM